MASLIVGIDPGTTIGYAVLDMEGKLIRIASSKQFDFPSLVSEVVLTGKPLVTGCDVSLTPKLVRKFATKTGSRVICPERDLLIKEKNELVGGFEERIEDHHQRDALASARYAYESIRPLLEKIDKFLKKEGKTELKEQVREIVISKRIPIREAIEIITRPEKEESKIIGRVIEKKMLNENDFIRLYKKLKLAEKEMGLLQQQNAGLKKELESARKPAVRQPKEQSTLIYFKEKTINALNKEMERKDRMIQRLQEQRSKINNMLANIDRIKVLKRLDNLGFKEFEFKNKVLNVRNDDVLLVKDADIYSQKTIDALKDKIRVIVFEKAGKNTQKMLRFLFIDAKKLKIKQSGFFAFADRHELEKAKSEKVMLEKVLDEYRKERI